MVPRSISGTPKRRQKTPKVASSATTRMSAHNASSMPPATAKPSTAAITGFDSRSRLGPIGAIESWPPISRFLFGIARCHRLEVGAGAEIAAGAGEHRDRGLGIGIEGAKRVEQLARGRAIDGVAAMRTIDGDDGHGPIAFDKDGIGFGHVLCSPAVMFWSSFRGDATVHL